METGSCHVTRTSGHVIEILRHVIGTLCHVIGTLCHVTRVSSCARRGRSITGVLDLMRFDVWGASNKWYKTGASNTTVEFCSSKIESISQLTSFPKPKSKAGFNPDFLLSLATHKHAAEYYLIAVYLTCQTTGLANRFKWHAVTPLNILYSEWGTIRTQWTLGGHSNISLSQGL